MRVSKKVVIFLASVLISFILANTVVDVRNELLVSGKSDDLVRYGDIEKQKRR